MKPKIAIEIGTAYTKIYKNKVDVVLCEPTCLAIKNGNYKKPVAIGYDAVKLIGKVNDDIQIIYPILGAEIVNMKGAIAMLYHFISKIKRRYERIDSAILSVGCGYDSSIIANYEYLLNKVGIYNISYAECPALSLLGAGVQLTESGCFAVVDMGASQTSICVLNLNGVISGISAELGGNNLNEYIKSELEQECDLIISDYQTETLKTSIASLIVGDRNKTVIQGKEATSAKPKSMSINAEQIYSSCEKYAKKITELIFMVLEKLPIESYNIIKQNGIYLTGGGAKLFGIKDYVFEQTGIRAIEGIDSDLFSIIGAGVLLEDKELLNKLKLKY